MVMILEQQMVSRIAAIGRERAPAEACGLMLPIPLKGRQIIELPNRSKTPQEEFIMLGSDMMIELEKSFDKPITEELLEGITAWHTHPKGNIGPSKADLEFKSPRLKHLVITLNEDNTAIATWY